MRRKAKSGANGTSRRNVYPPASKSPDIGVMTPSRENEADEISRSVRATAIASPSDGAN